MLDAYAAGVNAFLATTRSLPIEHRLLDLSPEPWLPWHCLSVFKIRHVFMGTFEAKLWRARVLAKAGPEGDGAALPLLEARRPRDHPSGRRVRGRGRGHRRAAYERERRRTAGRGGLRRKRRRQQLVGGGRFPHRVGQAVARRRSAPRSRHPQRLLPEPHLMPRVRRDRPLLRRTARLPSLRPQPFRGLVRHPHRRRLSGPLRRALRRTLGRQPSPVRVPRRVARRDDVARDDPRPGRPRRRHRRRIDAPRAHRRRRSRTPATPSRSAIRQRRLGGRGRTPSST